MKSKRKRNTKQNKIKEQQKWDRGREERCHMENFESMIQ
jgi:hypothetical protein